MKFAILFTILLMLCSCNYKQISYEAPFENAIKINETFRISLPENHTTGYMWQLNNHYNNTLLDYYGSVFRGNEKGVDFNFKTLKKGKGTLNFALIKYRDTSAVKQFIVTI